MPFSSLDKHFSNFINVVITAFYPLFFIFTTPKDGKCRIALSLLLNFLFCVYSLNLIVKNVYLAYFEAAPIGFVLSIVSGNIFSIVIRIILVKKSQLILFAIRQIFILHRNSQLKTIGNVYIIITFCTCWWIPFIMCFDTFKMLFSKGGVQFIQMKNLYGLNSKNTSTIFLEVLLRFMHGIQAYAVPECCAVLCCFIFKYLTDAIKYIEKNIKVKQEIREIYYYLMDRTQKVSKCLEEIETAFSLMLLLLYCNLTSRIFTAMTSIISAWPKMLERDKAIEDINILIMSLVRFYLLSFQAASVHDSALSLRKTIYNLCTKFPFSICSQNCGGCFLLLMADELERKIQINVWGLFSLNRGFIIQSSSVILTYGIIISQLGYTQ